jgi:hypothetical protein
MTNAERNRQEAIGMLIELYVPESRNYELQSINTAEIAGNIEKLAALGKTDRWQAAIKRWASMVRESSATDVNRPSIRWALIQGCVYANHAS